MLLLTITKKLAIKIVSIVAAATLILVTVCGIVNRSNKSGDKSNDASLGNNTNNISQTNTQDSVPSTDGDKAKSSGTPDNGSNPISGNESSQVTTIVADISDSTPTIGSTSLILPEVFNKTLSIPSSSEIISTEESESDKNELIDGVDLSVPHLQQAGANTENIVELQKHIDRLAKLNNVLSQYIISKSNAIVNSYQAIGEYNAQLCQSNTNTTNYQNEIDTISKEIKRNKQLIETYKNQINNNNNDILKYINELNALDEKYSNAAKNQFDMQKDNDEAMTKEAADKIATAEKEASAKKAEAEAAKTKKIEWLQNKIATLQKSLESSQEKNLINVINDSIKNFTDQLNKLKPQAPDAAEQPISDSYDYSTSDSSSDSSYE